MNALMSNYARYPLALVRGRGSRVWDAKDREYIDFVAGIAVNTLGHAHPAMVQAIAEQAATMIHCSNLYHIPLQTRLAERLCALASLDEAFFCNSGAEANEAAIKLARKYFHDRGMPRHTIITANASFHGRTLATLTATGQDKVKQGFAPLPAGFKHVPLNDLAALEQAIDEQTAAVMLEPIQGEGGVHIAEDAYLRAVRALCDKQGLLLIFDEVQTGIGRTGHMFAFEHAGVRPDILTLAKGLGGGVPIGATLARREVSASFGPGSHGSTFGGNPLSCRAALTVLDVIERERIIEHVRDAGAMLRSGLESLCAQFACLAGARGRGLLLGLALKENLASDIIERAREEGLLLLPAGNNVVRCTPALNIPRDDIRQGLDRLTLALTRLGGHR